MSYATQNVAVPIAIASTHAENHTPAFQTSPIPYRSMKLRSRHPTSLMGSEASAEDDLLYMASKPATRSQRSLSPIINRSLKGQASHSEPHARIEDDIARENMVWDIINREISEWQNICQTGRPSWWSPVSKWTRNGARSTWQDELHAIPPWRKNFDYTRRPKQRYDTQRRAVTEGYLADNNNVQGLAHLVAVQLLSACFTLPPSHMSSYKSSAYHCFDTLSTSEIPNSRLISSLRMHTEVRYTPAFGHEARNTSPSYRWHAAYDGPSLSRSHTQSPDRKSSDNHNFIKFTRPRRKHGAVNASDGLAAEYVLDCHQGDDKSDDFIEVVYPRKGLERNAKSLPSSPCDSNICLPRVFRLGRRALQSHPNDAQRRSNHYTLQPVIRSEAHPIYIQPVKDMIVKRWHSLRRRFGQKLGGGHPDSARTFDLSTGVASASSKSSPGERTPIAQVGNGNVKEQGRHTREWSDIHSSSLPSNPRYNTPTSASDSGIISPAQLELASTYVQTPESLVEEQGVATVIRRNSSGLSFSSTRLPSATLSNLEASLNVPSFAVAAIGSLSFEPEPSISAKPYLSHPRSLPSAVPFSKRHSSQRRQRRSMLSEVCTPSDIEEQRNVHSAAGSALTNPTEGVHSSLTGAKSPPGLSHDVQVAESACNQNFEMTVMKPQQDETNEEDRRMSIAERPAVFRTNTSGSQVFRPAEDGVEVDGFPVGPPAEAWDDIVDGIKIRERSFL